MKRALRNFGNVLGNCLYDKGYLEKIKRVKALPSRWTEDSLHRHPDYTPVVRKEVVDDTPMERELLARRTASEPSHVSLATMDYDDEYGGDLFDDVDFLRPDEMMLDEKPTMDGDTLVDATMTGQALDGKSAQEPSRQPIARVKSIPHIRQSGPAQGHIQNQGQHQAAANQPPARQQIQQKVGQTQSSNPNSRPLPNGGRMLPPHQQTDNNQQPKPQGMPNQQTSYPQNQQKSNATNQPQQTRATSTPEQHSQNSNKPQNQLQLGQPSNAALPQHDPPVGFITARAAEKVQGATVITPDAPLFNPHAESPSIRKTSGVDHRRSGPITRQTIEGAAPPVGQGGPNMPTQNATVPQPPPNRANFINPHTDMNRKIGMPGALQSPVANRSAYKPPGPATGLKRGPDGAGRPPLADMSNMQQQQGDGDGTDDAKRQKLAGS
jgi:DNA repair and recombination protein RAD52